MEARNSRYRSTRDRNRPSFAAAATLLGVYTALYLAFAGLVHFMTSPDAEASLVQESAPTAAIAAAETTSITVETIATRPLDPATDETDNSRECRLDAAIDSACIFD